MRVRETLRPELVGRVSEIVVFARLDYATQRAICEGMIKDEVTRLVALGHYIEVNPDVVEFLVRAGYHRTLGARPMRGAVERLLQDAVAMNVIERGAGRGRIVMSENCARLVLR